MNRDYTSGVVNGVRNFVGYEVEKTSCHGLKTYFVADDAGDPLDVVTKASGLGCEHIYLGANKYYQKATWVDSSWINSVVARAFKCGIQVTVDIPHSLWWAVSKLLLMDNLHLNISVELPNIERCPHVNIKVDDVGYSATNPGVRVFSLNDCEEHFNDWDAYKEDEIV